MKVHSPTKQFWANQSWVKCIVLVMASMSMKYYRFVLWSKVQFHHIIFKGKFFFCGCNIIWLIDIHEKLGPENQVQVIEISRSCDWCLIFEQYCTFTKSHWNSSVGSSFFRSLNDYFCFTVCLFHQSGLFRYFYVVFFYFFSISQLPFSIGYTFD